MEVGPRRLDDGQRERLLAVGHGEVGGRAERLGEPAQHRHGEVAQEGLHAAGQVQHAEPDEEPGARVAADQPVLLEGADQPVDDRAVDLEAARELGDRQALGTLGQHPEDAQAAVERLRGLGGHRRHYGSGSRLRRSSARPTRGSG